MMGSIQTHLSIVSWFETTIIQFLSRSAARDICGILALARSHLNELFRNALAQRW
jgi:hypothetical protein